jgi:hypothetical protein
MAYLPGTFLVRPSSQRGSYAISWVTVENEIRHDLVGLSALSSQFISVCFVASFLYVSVLSRMCRSTGSALGFPLLQTRRLRLVSRSSLSCFLQSSTRFSFVAPDISSSSATLLESQHSGCAMSFLDSAAVCRQYRCSSCHSKDTDTGLDAEWVSPSAFSILRGFCLNLSVLLTL